MSDPLRFSETFTLRCDPALSDVIRRASRARGSKPVEWLRQAAQTAARLDGIEPAEMAPQNADEPQAPSQAAGGRSDG